MARRPVAARLAPTATHLLLVPSGFHDGLAATPRCAMSSVVLCEYRPPVSRASAPRRPPSVGTPGSATTEPAGCAASPYPRVCSTVCADTEAAPALRPLFWRAPRGRGQRAGGR